MEDKILGKKWKEKKVEEGSLEKIREAGMQSIAGEMAFERCRNLSSIRGRRTVATDAVGLEVVVGR